jgi:hypothetical protein
MAQYLCNKAPRSNNLAVRCAERYNCHVPVKVRVCFRLSAGECGNSQSNGPKGNLLKVKAGAGERRVCTTSRLNVPGGIGGRIGDCSIRPSPLKAIPAPLSLPRNNAGYEASPGSWRSPSQEVRFSTFSRKGRKQVMNAHLRARIINQVNTFQQLVKHFYF